MYHTEPPTDKTIREWYMNSSRVAACALRNEQAVRTHGPGHDEAKIRFWQLCESAQQLRIALYRMVFSWLRFEIRLFQIRMSIN